MHAEALCIVSHTQPCCGLHVLVMLQMMKSIKEIHGGAKLLLDSLVARLKVGPADVSLLQPCPSPYVCGTEM